MLISEFSKISGIESGCLIFVIDENIWNIYQTELKERMGLLEKEKRILMWICPAGESTKNFDEYQKCLEYLLKNNVHRSSHLIAIGGGATSDFAGFVASTILRGIPWSVIPTTLLAMVDASIGGKTAINSSFGKNLIGTFHKPENIWLNSKFLKTLNNDEIQSGKGEILKYALLDKDLFEVIQTNPDDLAQIIYQCAEYKSQIVANDYLEQGGRKVLNLGHTIGHALEKIYQIPHGVAVVWGIFLQDQLFNQSVLLKEIESTSQWR